MKHKGSTSVDVYRREMFGHVNGGLFKMSTRSYMYFPKMFTIITKISGKILISKWLWCFFCGLQVRKINLNKQFLKNNSFLNGKALKTSTTKIFI
jgi:L-asparagine transporter-like permease